MSTGYTHNRASFRKKLLSMIGASVLRRGDAGARILLRYWSVSLLMSVFFVPSGLFSFEPCAVLAKESAVKLGSYEVIVSKDPFDPERGKSEKSAEDDTSSAKGDLKSHYQVYGTIIAGGVRLAYLKVATPESSKPLRRASKSGAKDLRTVVIGDFVDGWRVEDITAQGIELESDGEYVKVSIFDEVKKERKATAPVALQTPQPKSQVRQAPQSTPAKKASTDPIKKLAPGSPKKEPVKRTRQYSKIPDPAKTSTSSEPQAETKGTEGSSNKPEFFTPPASPAGGQGGPNPFLELIRKARGE